MTTTAEVTSTAVNTGNHGTYAPFRLLYRVRTTPRELDLITVSATRLWAPKHVMITRAVADLPHTAEIIRRCELAGVEDIRFRSGNALTGLRGTSDRETYASAKNTLAVVVAPPSALKPQPIPPSADWRIDLARGCPAHCQYCYLAGSLQGPPVTRVYANIDDVLNGVRTHAGRGSVTRGTLERGDEGWR